MEHNTEEKLKMALYSVLTTKDNIPKWKSEFKKHDVEART